LQDRRLKVRDETRQTLVHTGRRENLLRSGRR